ncbi:MAG: S8 family peptidase [Actinomycetota bacterium]|nr:S8 family peptidase [Actinomycetota bacterium]
MIAVLTAGLAAGGSAGAAPAPSSSPSVVVRFTPRSDAAARAAALARHRLAVVDSMPGTEYVLVGGARPVDPAVLEAEPAVADAHRAATVHALGASGAAEPNDELFKAQWHLRAIGIPRAWDVSTGERIVVAVLDTGVAYEDFGPFTKAPDLAGTTFVPGWDFVDDDSHPNDYPVPGKGSHGTSIAGTIAQTTNNGTGAAGVAPGASIMPIRVLSPDERGTSFTVAKGLRFAADRGAHVANLSLGTAERAPELADAIEYALGKGVTVIASSGDNGTSAVTFPASHPDVVAVGATGYDNARAEYSSYGAELDLVAPGGVLGEDQNHDGLEDGVVQQAVYEVSSSFCYCFRQGTSSAAAHVSGVAALVLAAGRAQTPAQVRHLLVSTAADLGPKGRDDEYGAGLLQAARALGLPPLPGETPPTVGAHHHEEEEGEEAPSDDVLPDRRSDGRGSAASGEALGGRGQEDSDTGLLSWLRRQRMVLVAAAGAVVVAYLVPFLVRRRRRE